MYWDDRYEVVVVIFPEKRPMARKNHDCCECNNKILIGEEYVRTTGVWRNSDDGSRRRDTYKMCLQCKGDWKAVLKVFRDNGQQDAGIVYGSLFQAVSEAFDEELIKADNSLVQRWLPWVEDFRTEEEKEADKWEKTGAIAVEKGLQPALPGFIGPLTAS